MFGGFELGCWAAPTILANIIIISLIVQKKFNVRIKEVFGHVSDFDVSKKIAIIVLIVMIVAYIGITMPIIDQIENYSDSAKSMKIIEDENLQFGAHAIHYLLTISSLQVFGNAKVFPLIGSVGLLVLAYFFSKELAQKRVAGLVSVGVIIESLIFRVQHILHISYFLDRVLSCITVCDVKEMVPFRTSFCCFVFVKGTSCIVLSNVNILFVQSQNGKKTKGPDIAIVWNNTHTRNNWNSIRI